MANGTSKLSLGPSNLRHKTFLQNERRLHETLNYALSSRRINLTAREIYLSAGITSPTFYLHCRDSDDAMRRYEQKLENNFYSLIPRTAKKDVVLTIFAVYIIQNRQYFVAALEGCDYYLVQKVIKHYRHSLAGNRSTPDFVVYAGEIVMILACWGKNGHFSKRTMPTYVEKMLKVK